MTVLCKHHLCEGMFTVIWIILQKVKKRILKIRLTILKNIVSNKFNNKRQKSVSKLRWIRSFVVEKCHTANFNLIRAPPPYQLLL